MSDDDYYTIRSVEASTGRAGRPNPLRAAALFAAVAVAFTVLAVPRMDAVERFAARQPLNLDPISTGSIRPGGLPRARSARDADGDTRTYIVRRSVLNGNSVCVLGEDGSRRGAC